MEKPSQSTSVKHNAPKRLFDVLFSALALFLFSPLFLLISILIKGTSKGSVFYTHQRIGRGGVPFTLYKFRTMYQHADAHLVETLRKNPKLQREWQATRKLKNDPRITPLGRWLRKTSLDELPQFWNALKGNLSIVGPRPVLKEELVQHYQSNAQKILSVRPGITGIWQISGRSNTTYLKRTELDLLYVNSHTLLLDLAIIIKTIPAVVVTSGAY